VRAPDSLDEVRADLKAIRSDLTKLPLDVAEMKGRISNIPTTFQLVFMFAAFVGATGLSLAVLKLAGAH
jgi:hypothetical protein